LVSGSALDRARPGNEEAFRDLIAPHLRELHLHCYRTLGSLADADDLLQETLAAAWLGLGSFAGPLVAADLALSHRHEPLPERRSRDQATGATQAGPPVRSARTLPPG
jgi:hypothetical protein